MPFYQVLNPLSMPPNSSNAQLLVPGYPVKVWNAETPVPGPGGASASQQVNLGGRDAYPGGFGVTGFFSGAPGAFEVDVQVSDFDVDVQYQTVANGNITTVDAVNNTFHFDGATVRAQFARLLLRSRANNVTITADFYQSS